MKLVIDIDDNTYAHLFDSGMEIVPQVGEILLAVKNGKQLPKVHGALKDADELAIAIAMLRDKCDYYGSEYESAGFQCYDIAVDKIIDAPTIIEADKEDSNE